MENAASGMETQDEGVQQKKPDLGNRMPGSNYWTVHLLRDYVAAAHYRLGLLFAAAAVLLLCGCGILQPSRSDLVQANPLDEPMSWKIQADCITQDVIMYYDSVVLTRGKCAQWDGSATVRYRSAYFHQQCRTICDGAQSAKWWRDRWLETDQNSPVVAVKEWLQMMEDGKGTFFSREMTLDTEQVYRVILPNVQPDWTSICDADFNSLFGGANMLTALGKADITLYFRAEDQSLAQIQLQSQTMNGTGFRATLTPLGTDTDPETTIPDTEEAGDRLMEEWSIGKGGEE